MRVTFRVPVEGLVPGAKIGVSLDCPVKDPSSGRVGHVAAASCVEEGHLDVSLELDEPAVRGRLRERRGAF